MITDLPELTVTRLCGYLLPSSIGNPTKEDIEYYKYLKEQVMGTIEDRRKKYFGKMYDYFEAVANAFPEYDLRYRNICNYSLTDNFNLKVLINVNPTDFEVVYSDLDFSRLVNTKSELAKLAQCFSSFAHRLQPKDELNGTEIAVNPDYHIQVVEKKMIKKSFENFEDVIPFITDLYKGYHKTIKLAKIKAIGVIECSL
jgi:hypothetical protein